MVGPARAAHPGPFAAQSEGALSKLTRVSLSLVRGVHTAAISSLTLSRLPRRTTLSKASTRKRAVVRDPQGTHVHLEQLEDVPEALEQDAFQRDLQRLLRHFCPDGPEREAK